MYIPCNLYMWAPPYTEQSVVHPSEFCWKWASRIWAPSHSEEWALFSILYAKTISVMWANLFYKSRIEREKERFYLVCLIINNEVHMYEREIQQTQLEEEKMNNSQQTTLFCETFRQFCINEYMLECPLKNVLRYERTFWTITVLTVSNIK